MSQRLLIWLLVLAVLVDCTLILATEQGWIP